MILKKIIFLLPYVLGVAAAILLPPHAAYELPGFLFGLHFKLDSFTHTFLLFTTFVWLLGALGGFLFSPLSPLVVASLGVRLSLLL